MLTRSNPRVAALVLVGLACALAWAFPAQSKRVRVYDNRGYTEETTDSSGNVVRRTTFENDGTPIRSEEIDRATGKTTEIDYQDGKPVQRSVRDADGDRRHREVYHETDDGGRIVDEQRYDEDGRHTDQEQRFYDRDGRLTQVDHRNEAGQLTEGTSFDYDENGNLVKANRTRFGPDGKPTGQDALELDARGNAVARTGNTSGIRDDLDGPSDPNVISRDGANGVRTVVRYNPDGSIDVKVYDSEGRVISLQYFQSGEYPGFPRPRSVRRAAAPEPLTGLGLPGNELAAATPAAPVPTANDLFAMRQTLAAGAPAPVFVPFVRPEVDPGRASAGRADQLLQGLVVQRELRERERERDRREQRRAGSDVGGFQGTVEGEPATAGEASAASAASAVDDGKSHAESQVAAAREVPAVALPAPPAAPIVANTPIVQETPSAPSRAAPLQIEIPSTTPSPGTRRF